MSSPRRVLAMAGNDTRTRIDFGGYIVRSCTLQKGDAVR